MKTKLNFHQLLGSQCNVLVILLKQSVISAQVQARTVKLDFQVLNKDHPYFLLLSTSCCVFSLCENTVPSQVFMCVYLQTHSSWLWKNSLFLSRMHLEVGGFLFVFFVPELVYAWHLVDSFGERGLQCSEDQRSGAAVLGLDFPKNDPSSSHVLFLGILVVSLFRANWLKKTNTIFDLMFM